MQARNFDNIFTIYFETIYLTTYFETIYLTMYFETISSAVLLDLAPNPQIWAHQYRAKIAAGKNDALLFILF